MGGNATGQMSTGVEGKTVYAPGTAFYTNPATGAPGSVNFGQTPEAILKQASFLNIAKTAPMTQQFQQQVGQNAGRINTNYQQNVPSLQTDFSSKPGLDQFSQQLLSQGQQQVNRGLASTQGQIARQFSGPLSQTLQSQAAMQSKLNANPLLFQVASQQVGRQQGEAQLSNQAKLAQQGAFNNALQSENQALALKSGLQGLPLQAQGNLINSLQGFQK